MTGMEVNDITSEQIINLGRLSDLQERLDSFASKNTDFQEFALNKQTRKFNTKMEADFQVFLAQAKKQPQETNKLLETYGSEK